MNVIEETIDATLDSNGHLQLATSRACRRALCESRYVSPRQLGRNAAWRTRSERSRPGSDPVASLAGLPKT